MSLNFNFLKSKKVISADTLEKMKAARVANIKANDLTVVNNVRDNVAADFFKLSNAMFAELGLENKGISISTEGTQLQIFILDEKQSVKMRGRGDKKKTTMFQYPEIIQFLKDNFGYTGEKMAFKIVKIAEGGTQQIGDTADDVITYYCVYTIEKDELIVKTKEKGENEEVAVVPTESLPVGQGSAPVAQAPVAPASLIDEEEEEEDVIEDDDDL